MTYTEKLEQWFQTERAAGRVVDLKFFPIDPDESVEGLCKAVYETLTGVRKTEPIDRTTL